MIFLVHSSSISALLCALRTTTCFVVGKEQQHGCLKGQHCAVAGALLCALCNTTRLNAGRVEGQPVMAGRDRRSRRPASLERMRAPQPAKQCTRTDEGRQGLGSNTSDRLLRHTHLGRALHDALHLARLVVLRGTWERVWEASEFSASMLPCRMVFEPHGTRARPEPLWPIAVPFWVTYNGSTRTRPQHMRLPRTLTNAPVYPPQQMHLPPPHLDKRHGVLVGGVEGDELGHGVLLPQRVAAMAREGALLDDSEDMNLAMAHPSHRVSRTDVSVDCKLNSEHP